MSTQSAVGLVAQFVLRRLTAALLIATSSARVRVNISIILVYMKAHQRELG